MTVRGRSLQVSVLGPVHVVRDGAEVALGARLERLLAVLAVSVHQVVSVDRLVDAVWGDEVPAHGETSLKSYVTRLRQAIGDVDGRRIVFRRPGYRLELEGDELDSVVFERELDTARLQLRLADDHEAAATLQRALARWRGRPFGDLGDEDWCRAERVRLEELRIEARELYVEALLGGGRIELAVAEARALVEDEPMRDRPRALLMRALHGAGRQGEALRVLPEFRRLLVEEMGLEVSPELLDLEARIARRDASLDGTARPLRGYELAERVGEGAFAVVHRAVQPGVDRDVAIKIIRAELADRPEFVRRFETEAQLVARLEHPNIVPIYDFWREPGAAYLVMRFVRGGTAEHALRRHGPWSRVQVVRLVTELGGALEYAHRRGIVHRDVRPANVLLDEDGNAYLSDFGIARPSGDGDAGPLLSPAYSAPEVLRGERIGPQADIVSLGVTVYELLTGRLPFADSTDRAELVRHQLEDPLPAVSSVRRDLPERVDEVIARATAKAPADRHATATAFVAELTSVLESGEGLVGRRVVPAAAGRPVTNPYLGLRAFDEADAATFHGREAHVAQLVDAVAAHRLVTVVGASGAGKSSLVRAGLVPALRRGAIRGSGDWFVTTMVPGTDPAGALEAALLRIAVNPPHALAEQLSEPGGLLRVLRRIVPSESSVVVLVIDQLEELFRDEVDVAERSRFLTSLVEALEHEHSPLRAVATLRADEFDAPLREPTIAELVAAGTVPLRPMTPGELEDAIVGPARAVGVDLEPALVAELVAATSERPTALPLLQFTLTELFERRVADVMLLSSYREVGGLSATLARRAERVLDDLGPQGVRIARSLFGRLVHVGVDGNESRRRLVRSEVEHDRETSWLVEAMVAARLLATDRDPQTRAATVEIAHEALLREWPRLRAWLDEDHDDLSAVRWIAAGAAAWRASEQDPGDLGRGRRLESASAVRRRRPDLLSPTEVAWVDASEAQERAELHEREARAERDRQQNRRLRRSLAGVAGVLVVAVLAGAVAVVQRGSALRSEAAAESALDDAEVERLAALSAAQAASDPARSILLALAAHDRRPDEVTQAMVFSALARQSRVQRYVPPFLDEESAVVLSVGGEVGVEWSLDRAVGRVAIFDVDGEELLRPVVDIPVGVDAVGVSGDGSTVAIQSGDVIRLIDVRGDAPERVYRAALEVWEVHLDDVGAHLVLAGLDQIAVVRTDTLEVVDEVSLPHPHTLVPWSLGGAASVSADGRYVAYAFTDEIFADGEVFGAEVVDLAADEVVFRYVADSGPPMSVSIAPGGTWVGIVVGDVPGVHELLLGHVGSGQVERRWVFDEGGVQVHVSDDGTATTLAGDGVLRFHAADGGRRAPATQLPVDATDVVHRSDDSVVIGRLGGGYAVAHVHLSALYDAVIPIGWPARMAPSGDSVSWIGDDGYSLWRASLGGGDHSPELVADLTAELERPAVFLQVSNDGRSALVIGGGVVIVTPSGAIRRVDLDELYRDLFGEPFLDTAPVAPRVADGGDRLFIRATLRSGQVRAVWIDLARGAIVAGPLDLASGHGPVRVLSGGRVVAGSPATAVHVIDEALSEARQLGDGDVFAVALSEHAASGRVALGGANGFAAVADVDSGVVTSLEPTGGFVTDAAFSPDGGLLAVRDVVSGISIRDLAGGRSTGVTFPAGLPGIEDGLAWAQDRHAVWFPTERHVVRLVLEPERWLDLACQMAGRDLTAHEWEVYVSDGRPQRSLCPAA